MKKLSWIMAALVFIFCIHIVAFADSVVLPAGLKVIEAEAFYQDSRITEVSVPEGTTTIGPRAFANSGLLKITLPRTINSISPDAFAGLDSDFTIYSPKGSYTQQYAIDNHFKWVDIDVSTFPDTLVFTWEDVAEDLDDIDEDGAWHQVGGYVLWLPSFFVDQELSDERLEQGYIANIMAVDESAAVIAFTDTNEEGADLEVLAEAYTGAGLEAEVVEVNGIPAMLYIDESSDTLNLLFLEGDDNEAETVISFYPLSDEGFSSLTAVVLCTVQQGILWSTVEEFAATVDEDAEFFQIGDYDLAIWIPSALSETELTDEDIENGYIAYLMTDDGEAGFSVTVTPAEGVTLRELKEYFEEVGIEDAELGLVNGIPALTYTYNETDSMNALFMSDEDEFMQVSCWPASDDGFSLIAMLIMSSIQVIE